MKEIITSYKYRLILSKKNSESDLNWVFLPGGLGFGSEYFTAFIESLHVPGSIWRCDFPEDGSNRFPDQTLNFDELWRPGLLDVICSLGKVVLVTHSASAMLALTFPKLEPILAGFIIISSAPSSKWREGVIERAKGRNLPCVSEQHQIYENNKNDETFKQFFLAILDYYVNPVHKLEALTIFNQLPYHYRRYEWLIHHFHKGYQAVWVPRCVPTIILGSSDDIVTPISLFQENDSFSSSNVVKIKNIPNAGHFPWIEQLDLMKRYFLSFASQLENGQIIK